ncbi:MAG: diaminopimelate epimerase [Bacillota bacterium]
MDYTKMHGAGNDFIIINNMVEEIPEVCFPDIARILCSRRTSIGADGIMFVDSPEFEGNFRMRFYNADGTEGEMCGNGARCICRYGFENGLAGEKQRVETISGTVEGWRVDKRIWKVRLNRPSTFVPNMELELEGEKYLCSYVELGTPGLPHLVLRMPGFTVMDEERLSHIGKGLRGHPSLYKGANVNFYDFNDDGEIVARTFERGVENFTLACGTGAAATGFALVKNGIISGGEIEINMPGGRLGVRLVENIDTYEDLILIGPTNMVSEGKVLDEDLSY